MNSPLKNCSKPSSRALKSEKEVIDEFVKLVVDGANPREARIAINQKFHEWDDREKLRKLIPKVEKQFPAIRQTTLRRTGYFKVFLIGTDDIRARGKKFSQKY